MRFLWRTDWTRHAHEYEGFPKRFVMDVRNDNLAVCLQQRTMLGAFFNTLLTLAAKADSLSPGELTRRHRAYRDNVERYAGFDKVHGNVAEGVEPCDDIPQIFHPDALPDDAAMDLGAWRAAVVIKGSWIGAAMLAHSGLEGIQMHEMMLGAAMERMQNALEKTVARHLQDARYALDELDHIEVTQIAELVRIEVLAPPPRRDGVSLVA